jgi:Protein of unknown function (DUF2510)
VYETEPGWYPNPDGSDDQRFWDGDAWTTQRRVKKEPPGWYPDPGGSRRERYWDGDGWTARQRPRVETATQISGSAERRLAGDVARRGHQATKPVTVTCSNGHRNSDASKFCAECGTPMGTAAGHPSESDDTSAWPPDRSATTESLGMTAFRTAPTPPKSPSITAPHRPSRTWPPSAGRPSQKTLLFLAGAAVLIVIVVVAVVATRPSKSNQSAGDASQSGLSAISGTQDNWIESVCVTGTFVDGEGGLPGNSGGGLCRAKGAQGMINISQFDSDYKMRNGIAMMHVQYYVSGIEPDGTVIAFSVLGAGGSPTALEPLTQYGFTVNSASTPH